MRKAAFIIIACLIALNVQAQSEHLKFMGIPLNGTMSSFQTKLQSKGIKYDAEGSRQLKVGCRKYNGVFSGEKADIYVYYDEKTKIVYRAKAVITCLDKEKGENKFYDFKSMLKRKYVDGIVSEGEQDGHPSLSILVADSRLENSLGFVGMYITNPPYSFMDEVYLHIDYEDIANRKANQNNNMDDL